MIESHLDESDFKAQGYSQRSLAMLENEEGQMNAIFACFGSAAQHGQFYEESLGKLISAITNLLGNNKSIKDVANRTIGQLLRLLMKSFVTDIDDWVPNYLDAARKKRNFLIHKYFLERSDTFASEDGRFRMLKELIDIESELHRATTLTNAMRIAISKSTAGKRDDMSGDQVVFSFQLDVGNEAT